LPVGVADPEGHKMDPHFRVADRAESIKSAAIDDAYLHS
jgi:hypothetical protein